MLKLQNAQTTQGRSFFHPLIQTICMFLGETLVGIAYWVSTTRRKRKQQLPVTNTINTISEGELFGNIYTSNKPKHRAPILIVILPTLMDLLSTLLSYIALNLISSSVWQMSRGGNIIVTAILSRLFLQHKFTWSGIFGCVLAFIGISSVQLINILLGENNSNNGNGEILGTILLVASICFNGLGLVL